MKIEVNAMLESPNEIKWNQMNSLEQFRTVENSWEQFKTVENSLEQFRTARDQLKSPEISWNQLKLVEISWEQLKNKKWKQISINLITIQINF